ncbi:MAG: hypothetical protein AABX85_01700 [Nanoarchaeota archaeon]
MKNEEMEEKEREELRKLEMESVKTIVLGANEIRKNLSSSKSEENLES